MARVKPYPTPEEQQIPAGLASIVGPLFQVKDVQAYSPYYEGRAEADKQVAQREQTEQDLLETDEILRKKKQREEVVFGVSGMDDLDGAIAAAQKILVGQGRVDEAANLQAVLDAKEKRKQEEASRGLNDATRAAGYDKNAAAAIYEKFGLDKIYGPMDFSNKQYKPTKPKEPEKFDPVKELERIQAQKILDKMQGKSAPTAEKPKSTIFGMPLRGSPAPSPTPSPEGLPTKVVVRRTKVSPQPTPTPRR